MWISTQPPSLENQKHLSEKGSSKSVGSKSLSLSQEPKPNPPPLGARESARERARRTASEPTFKVTEVPYGEEPSQSYETLPGEPGIGLGTTRPFDREVGPVQKDIFKRTSLALRSFPISSRKSRLVPSESEKASQAERRRITAELEAVEDFGTSKSNPLFWLDSGVTLWSKPKGTLLGEGKPRLGALRAADSAKHLAAGKLTNKQARRKSKEATFANQKREPPPPTFRCSPFLDAPFCFGCGHRNSLKLAVSRITIGLLCELALRLLSILAMNLINQDGYHRFACKSHGGRTKPQLWAGRRATWCSYRRRWRSAARR